MAAKNRQQGSFFSIAKTITGNHRNNSHQWLNATASVDAPIAIHPATYVIISSVTSVSLAHIP